MQVLFDEAQGDVVQAKKLAGYADGSSTKAIIEGLKDEIFEATKTYMARLGPKAAVAYGSALVDPTQLGIKEKMVAANSSQTTRSRSRTGKHSRQLVSPWTDAWESEQAPDPLPMPLQPMVAEPALQKVAKLAEGGHDGARDLATYWVGQGVGLMNQSISASDVVQEFKEDFAEAYERLTGFVS